MATAIPNTPPLGVTAPTHPLANRRAVPAPVGDAPDRRASRRRFLAETGATIAAALGVTAAVLAPDPNWGAATTSNPDAALLALCAAFHALHAEAEATTTDEALTAAQERRREVQHQLQPIAPITAAGQAANAKVAMHLLDEAFGSRFPGDFLDFGLTTLAEIAGTPLPAAVKDDGRKPTEPAVFPDAELLTACAAADAIQARIDALWADPVLVADDARLNPLVRALEEEEEPFLDQVYVLQAQTLAGHRARARTLALWDKETFRSGGSWNELLASALVRDLIGEEGA